MQTVCACVYDCMKCVCVCIRVCERERERERELGAATTNEKDNGIGYKVV